MSKVCKAHRVTDTAILNRYLELLEETERNIGCRNRINFCRQAEVYQLLRRMPGIGDVFAVTIRHEIDDNE